MTFAEIKEACANSDRYDYKGGSLIASCEDGEYYCADDTCRCDYQRAPSGWQDANKPGAIQIRHNYRNPTRIQVCLNVEVSEDQDRDAVIAAALYNAADDLSGEEKHDPF